MITFKFSSNEHTPIELPYVSDKLIIHYRTQIAEQIGVEPYRLKLVFQGRVLDNHDRPETLSMLNGKVIAVISREPKPQAPVETSSQVLQGVNMNTGFGAAAPVGFSNFSMMNHPGYMSAISNIADETKMEEFMNDPYNMSQINSMLSDPDTFRYLIDTNPHLKQMMESNPMLKMAMSNNQMFKMLFNPDTIKLGMDMMKNGTIDPQQAMQNMNNPNLSIPTMPITQPNPYQNIPSLGLPFQMPQPQPNQQMPSFPGMQMNPFQLGSMMPQQFNQASQQPQQPFQMPFISFAPMQPQIVTPPTQFTAQMAELTAFGFTDATKNLSALQRANGNVDEAIEILTQEQTGQGSKQ